MKCTGFALPMLWLRFPDYDDVELEATVLLDTLQSEAPALTKTQSDALFFAVEADYMDITVRRERLKKLKTDPYFNALQVKYAYAVTCHKAQGGQWQRVFVDQGYVTEDMLTPIMSVAVHSLYPGHGNFVSGELAAESNGKRDGIERFCPDF